MKAIRSIHSFFQEGSLKFTHNYPILAHRAILQRMCVALKVSENTQERRRKQSYMTTRSKVNIALMSVKAVRLNETYEIIL
jgi:hypothetical protein